MIQPAREVANNMSNDWNWHVNSLQTRLNELQQTIGSIKSCVEQRPGLDAATQAIASLLGSTSKSANPLFEFPRALSDILSNPLIGAILTGPKGDILFYNYTAESILGIEFLKHRSMTNTSLEFSDFANNKVLEVDQLPWVRALRGDSTPNTRLKIHGTSRAGSVWINASATPFTTDSQVSGVVLFLTDTSEEVELEADIETLCNALDEKISQVADTHTQLAHLADRLSNTGVQRILSGLAPSIEEEAGKKHDPRLEPAPSSETRPPATYGATESSVYQSAPPAEARHHESTAEPVHVGTARQSHESVDSAQSQSMIEAPSHSDAESSDSGHSQMSSENEPALEIAAPETVAEVEPEEAVHAQDTDSHEGVEEQPEDALHEEPVEVLQEHENTSEPESASENWAAVEPVDSEHAQPESEASASPESLFGKLSKVTEDKAAGEGEGAGEPWAEPEAEGEQGEFWEGDAESGDSESPTATAAQYSEPATPSNGDASAEGQSDGYYDYSTAYPEYEYQNEGEEGAASEEGYQEDYQLEPEAGGEQYGELTENDANYVGAEGELEGSDSAGYYQDETLGEGDGAQVQSDEYVEEVAAGDTGYSEEYGYDDGGVPSEVPPAPPPDRSNTRRRASASYSRMQALGGASELEDDYLSESLTGESQLVPYSSNAEEEAVFSGKRVLIVDDIPLNQELLRAHMERLGYDADVANNGQEALDLVSSNKYGLIMMDCDMPVMDGFEAARRIRSNQAYSHDRVPILGMSSQEQAEELDKCIAAGMDECISKSATLTKLRESIDAIRVAQGEEPELAQLDPVLLKIEGRPFSTGTLQELYGDAVTTRICKLFLSNMNTYIERMQDSIDKKSSESVSYFANSINGASAALGMRLLVRLAADINSYSESGDWTQVRVKYMRLKAVFAQKNDELKALIQDDTAVTR